MKQFYKIAFIVCLAFLYWCLPLTAQCQYGFPYNSYGGYWQAQYNQPYPNFSSRIGTNPFTAYNQYQNQMVFTNPSAGWQSSYFQQNSPQQFQQNNPYQIGPYGNTNPNLAYPRLVSAYSSGNSFNNSSYYGDNYGYVLPYGSGPSTYFHLLPSDYILRNDPYTLAQQAKRTTSDTSPDYNETVIGRVVGSNSIDVNGRIIRCHELGSPVLAEADRPLDLSSYMGMIVEVTGDFFGDDLYSASFDGVVE